MVFLSRVKEAALFKIYALKLLFLNISNSDSKTLIKSRARMVGVFFKNLSMEGITSLEAHFSLLDIKEASWDSTKNKIPIPDGFRMRF